MKRFKLVFRHEPNISVCDKIQSKFPDIFDHNITTEGVEKHFYPSIHEKRVYLMNYHPDYRKLLHDNWHRHSLVCLIKLPPPVLYTLDTKGPSKTQLIRDRSH